MRSLRPFAFSALLIPGLRAANYQDHLGLQLWSLGDTTKESTTEALDLAAKFGFTEVEAAGTGSSLPPRDSVRDEWAPGSGECAEAMVT